MSTREPVLNPIAIKHLHPTQMTVGFREVAEKQRQWREQAGDKGSEFLGRHMITVGAVSPTATRLRIGAARAGVTWL